MVALQGPERDTLYDKMTENNLIPRAGTADEVAGGILFVIKGGFVTSATVDVDGGWLLGWFDRIVPTVFCRGTARCRSADIRR